MEQAFLFEQYDPQKFESQLKKFNQLSDADKQKLLIGTFINPTSYFFTPLLKDGKSFKMMQTKDKKLIFPVFTSSRQAMKDPTFDVTAKMYRGNIAYYGNLMEKEPDILGLVVNYSPDQPGIVISRESVLQMRATFLKRVESLKATSEFAALRSVSYRIPSREEASRILEATRYILSNDASISSCWLRKSSTQDQNDKELAQIVYIIKDEDFTEDKASSLKQTFTEALVSVLKEGEAVDVIDAASPLGVKLTAGAAPDYRMR